MVDNATSILESSIEVLQEEAYDPRSGPRRYTRRPRGQYHQHLVDDYFSENPLYPASDFRWRFRMSRPLFLRIVDELGRWSDYFTTAGGERRHSRRFAGLQRWQSPTDHDGLSTFTFLYPAALFSCSTNVHVVCSE